MKSIARIAIVILLASVSASAQVTYLSCDVAPQTVTWQDDSHKVARFDPIHFDFTLDEGKGTISWFGGADGWFDGEPSSANQHKAVFTYDKVNWFVPISLFSSGEGESWVISRTDLSINSSMLLKVGDQVFLDLHRQGRCLIKDPATKKF